MPQANGISVLWGTGHCRSSPCKADCRSGSRACAPGAQAGLSYPDYLFVFVALQVSQLTGADRTVAEAGMAQQEGGMTCMMGTARCILAGLCHNVLP